MQRTHKTTHRLVRDYNFEDWNIDRAAPPNPDAIISRKQAKSYLKSNSSRTRRTFMYHQPYKTSEQIELEKYCTFTPTQTIQIQINGEPI